jgi:hypothetical protein
VQSDEVPQSVLATATDMVKRLGYEGIAEIEFNRDEKTGAFHLLEMNPRCWGWIGITEATDCNVPWIAYRDLTGQELAGTIQGPRPGSVKMLFLVMDASSVFLRYRKDHPEWVQSLRAWWKGLESEKLIVWEIDGRDWRGTLWCFLELLWKGLAYAARAFGRRWTGRPLARRVRRASASRELACGGKGNLR